MKKIIKDNIKIILAVVIAVIITSGISVYATYQYFAKDIGYTKKDGSQVSVEAALNELYVKSKNISSEVVASQQYTQSTNNPTGNIEYTFEKKGYVIVNFGTRSAGGSTGTTTHSIKINDVEKSSNNENLWGYLNTWTGNVEAGDTIKVYVNDTAGNAAAFAFINFVENMNNKNDLKVISGTNSRENGIEQFTIDRDCDNAFIVSGQISLEYAINQTDNFSGITTELGRNVDSIGLYYSENISLKKGDILYLRRDTSSSYGYTIFY